MGDVIALRPAAALTPTESARLTELEAVVTDGVAAFVRAGRALREIHDSGLFRATAPTWEQYIDSKWGMSKRHADRLIGAAEAVENLGPIGPVLPATESQARPLAALQPDEQREVWRTAVDTAPLDESGRPKLTAAHVERVVEARKPRPAREVLPESPTGDSEAEPDPIDALRTELAAADTRIREQDALIASLQTADHHREVVALHARIAQHAALLEQARAEASEARRQASWAMAQLRRIMRVLGLDDPRAIVPAIEELQR